MAVSFCGKRIVLTRSCLLKTTKRKCGGFIILLPEIGEDLPEKNPLLKDNGLPEFNTFTIERSIAAIGKQTVEFEQGVQNIEDNLEGNENINIAKDIIYPLEEISVPLETTWGITKTLYFGNQSLVPKNYYENIHKRMNEARGATLISVPIYKACKAALDSKETKLSDSEKAIAKKFTLDARLNGLTLEGKIKFSYEQATATLDRKREEVRQKLKFSALLFNHVITNPNVVRDFPEDYLKMIAIDPGNPTQGPWRVTLQSHIAPRFMELCPNRDLRWNIWQATVMRSSQLDESNIRTSGPIEDIRANRIMQAKALGYESYSHLSMETKMAGSLENIYDVLGTLLKTARPAQKDELNELTEFAHSRGFDGSLQEWDIEYWTRKHRRSVYNVKDEVIRNYFPLPNVLKGLFDLVEMLFDIKIIETRKTDIWHADVRFFDVIDLKEMSDEPIASFYLDPYARRDISLRMKKEAGWMVAIRGKSVHTSTNPLAALIFNFQRPNNDKPSLLSIKDVEVLFQKFGHALQYLLTKVELSEVAGTANVEWDAVGISGHLLANWLYEPTVIEQLASHYESGEPMPEELVDSLTRIRSHMAGYRLCNELYLSKFDLQMYEFNEFWVDMMARLWKEHFDIPQNWQNNHVCTWDAVTIGSWAAAYYSDLWSKMVAADAYSAFQEVPAGDENLMKETANRYRETFLSLGGSCRASEVFRKFRGRDPSPKALLKNLGLKRKQIESV